MCEFCKSAFTTRQAKYKHKKKCKVNNNEIDKDKIKLELLKEENKKMKLEIKLKKLNNKENKITTSFRALNRKFKERAILKQQSNDINNNTNNNQSNNNLSHNTNSNNTINNNQINIYGFGKEEVIGSLSNKDIKYILNGGFSALENIIEVTNCGNSNECKNIIIPNLKDNYAYTYDDKKEYFVPVDKNVAVTELMSNRLENIITLYEENGSKLDPTKKQYLENFLVKINDKDKKIIQEENKTHKNYFEFKKDSVIILLYDNNDKINNDLAINV